MASIGEWAVGVFVNFQGNGVREMQRLALAAGAVNDQLKRQQGLLTADQAALNRYNRQMAELGARRQQIVAGIASTVAVAGTAAMADAVTQAAKLQTIFVAIQNATGATAQQMERYSQRFYDIADRNGMAVQDAAEIVRVFARSSGGRLSLDQIMDLTQNGGAQFAMVMKNARGESYDAAATQAITLAHMFRAYDPQGLAKMFDAMAHLGEMMPHNLNAAITQMGYFLPKLKTMGVDDASAVALMAWLDQSGYGRGKGGTGLRSLIEQGLGPLQITGHVQAGKAKLLHEMGLLDAADHSPFYDAKTRSFNVFGYLGAIHDWVARQPRLDTALKTITSTFGTQGGNIAALMADPTVVSGLQQLRAFSTDPRVSQGEQGKRYENTVGYQAMRAWNNFQSLMTELAWPWLGKITNFLRSTGDKLHDAQKYLHEHKDIEKTVGAVIAAITSAATGIAALASLNIGGKVLASSGTGTAASSVFMGLGGWIDSVLFGGALSKIALGVLDLLEGRGGALLLRMIPGVGWALAAIEGLALFVRLVENLPTIVTAIHNWWAKWQGPIGYTIGWAFGEIGRMIVAGAHGLVFIVRHAFDGLGLGDLNDTPEQFWAKVQANMALAQKQWDLTQHPGFWDELHRGAAGGFAGHGFQPHVQTQVGVNVYIDGKRIPSTADIHASSNGAWSPSGRPQSGVIQSSPFVPRMSSAGSMGSW